MKQKLLLSWSTGEGDEHDGGKIIDPDFSVIEKSLQRAWNKSGIVNIDIIDGPDLGPQNLQVQIENRMSVIALGINTEDDYVVRSYLGNKNHDEVLILGNLWPAEQVCTNYDTVYQIFWDFFSSGDVSTERLN